MRIDNTFYIGEYGFFFNLVTGIDMNQLADADVVAVWRKPDGSTLTPVPSIPVGDRVNPTTGEVNVAIPQGLFATAGDYRLQIAAKKSGAVVGSRHIDFPVVAGAAPDLSAVFV